MLPGVYGPDPRAGHTEGRQMNEEKWLYVAALAMLLCSIALMGYAFWLVQQPLPTVQITVPNLSEILK